MDLRTRFVALLCLALGLSSCGGSTEPSPVLTTITVSLTPTTIFVGEAANAIPAGLDQNGASIATGPITWSTASGAVATVNINGVVTGVAPGTTDVIATSGTRQGKATITVIPVPVASVVVTPATNLIAVGETKQLTATPRDANSNALTGRTTTWTSSDQTKATVSSTGVVTGVAAGSATITATVEGKSGTAEVTVVPSSADCTSATALQLAVGALRVLSASEKLSFCVGSASAASEYVLIPFHASGVAASNASLHFTPTKTTVLQSGASTSLGTSGAARIALNASRIAANFEVETEFRKRELRDLAGISFARARQAAGRTGTQRGMSRIIGVPATPVVGSIVDVNASVTGNLCTSPRQTRGARVAAVLPRTIVLIDTLAPAGGYTTAELTSFGQQFDTLGYDIGVANFGAPSDLDSDGRVTILFTPTINAVPVPPGAVVGGLFTARDLFPPSVCTSSNAGEMFYAPVPDPNSTINGNYKDKTVLGRGVFAVLVHEFQHLINAGRRIYVTDADAFEEVWLNEGLSHIAEELLYYRVSGNTPRSNIDLGRLRSTQAQLDAVNSYQINNFSRLMTYMKAPETNSPYAQGDDLATRGAIWQLLRYASDRKGGAEQATWFSLVNSVKNGQENFSTVLGSIVPVTRDWVVAQFTDDSGLPVSSEFTHPSWNFRSVLPAINELKFPLRTQPLLANLDITLVGGGAAYLRFGVNANDPATVRADSGGQPVPATVEFILIRTQ